MNWWLVISGFLVHLVFFYSIFDIYFTSPLIHGMTPQSTQIPAPAQRLVLFVGDGLRADKLFELDENNESRAPFLRDKIEHSGAWGVSHTRVPTESRPGHVALIAGFYEDVSAVAKGWKENPVEFDSVFNESRYTWSWGSPDILPMFSKGASGDHVFVKMYEGENEDFAGSNLEKLDTWVFDEVKEFFKASQDNSTLIEMLRQDRVILFLHLLGLDTNGHAHKPYSQEYLENIKTVDRGLEQTVEIIEEFFDHDGSTSYVFSSDHGMTNWGSHGAGHPSETLTPLVAWGAGIRPAEHPTDPFEDGFEKEWRIGSRRTDVLQADICPLMATLLGLNLPLNSVGVLPVDYLDGAPDYKAQTLFTNARQIVAQFEMKMKQKQETTLSLLFTPFKKMTPSMQAAKMREITKLLQHGEITQAMDETTEMINLALEGLNYYHNYDRFFLGLSIACGFIGWVTYILTKVIQSHTSIMRSSVRLDQIQDSFWSSEKGIRIIFLCVVALMMLLLFVQSLPFTHYLYCLVPVVVWHKVIQRRDTLFNLCWYIGDHGYVREAAQVVVIGFIGIELMVQSFFHRELLSVGFVAMAVWPHFTTLKETNKTLCTSWLGACLVMAVFPLLPVVGRHANYSLVYLAAIVGLGLAIYCGSRPETGMFRQTATKTSPDGLQTRILFLVQLLILCTSLVLVWNTSQSIAQHTGLPGFNQCLSWCILVVSVVLPLLSSSRLYPRLVSISLSLLPAYLLLSTAQEGLFYLTLCVLLFLWIHIETCLGTTSRVKVEELDFQQAINLGEAQRKLALSDVRCAAFFIFFLICGFFGTGNIASINTFDPQSVMCFQTVFNPFVMGGLMMWKNVVPLLVVTCAFAGIHLSIRVPTQSLFLLVLIISDCMALQFFFLVRDHGSWLDIGTSISHYVIVMTIICFLYILLSIAKVMTCYSLRLLPGMKKHSQ